MKKLETIVKKSKPKYPQMHSIKLEINFNNYLVKEREIERIHHRLKYQAKYNKSKWYRRLYD